MAMMQNYSAARDRLRVLSEQANKLCGSRDAITKESTTLCVYDPFQDKDGDQQKAMMRELLKSLSCKSDHCSLVSVITRTLQARDAVEDIINTNFDGHILLCSPHHRNFPKSTTKSTSMTCTRKCRRSASRIAKTDPKDICLAHRLQNSLPQQEDFNTAQHCPLSERTTET